MLERQFERRWQTSSLVFYSLPSPGLDSQPVYHAIQKQIYLVEVQFLAYYAYPLDFKSKRKRFKYINMNYYFS